MADHGTDARRTATPKGVAGLVARAVPVDGRPVRLWLEPSYWEALSDIARREDMTIGELCTDLAFRMEDRQWHRRAGRDRGSLANAVRVFVVGYYRQAATERGHERAGHGQGALFNATPFDISDSE